MGSLVHTHFLAGGKQGAKKIPLDMVTNTAEALSMHCRQEMYHSVSTIHRSLTPVSYTHLTLPTNREV
mgnify:CR=1 FL=1